jgi:peroxiredoxin
MKKGCYSLNQVQRYWFRRILFVVMFGLIAYALYQTFTATDKNRLDIGDEAPDFQIQTLDGKTVQLSDYRGKVVLLNFWATWCKPCRTEMPDIQRVYDKFKERNFEVLAVNIAEQPVTVNSFAKGLRLTFPIGLDSQKEITKMYKVGPLPASFFIDQEGKIAQIFQGQMNIGNIEQGVLAASRN